MAKTSQALKEQSKPRRYPAVEWTLFALSLCYLIAEVVFNVRMLDAAGTSLTEPKVFEDVQVFGRLVSASGFTLLMLEICRKFNFRFDTAAKQYVLGVIMFVCLTPFFLSFGSIVMSTLSGARVPASASDPEMIWSFVALCALPILFVSQGQRPVLTVIGLVMMAWPSMYFGQKLLVERFVIEPTSWQERLGAQYVLIARMGAEDCLIELGDLDFCDASKKEADVRSVNAILPALTFRAAKAIWEDVINQKNDIIMRMAGQNKLVDRDAAYTTYLSKLDAFEELIQREQERGRTAYIDGIYRFYAEASQLYRQSTDPALIQALTNTFWQRLEMTLSKGWSHYQSGTVQYEKTLVEMSINLHRQILTLQKRYLHCPNKSELCYTIKDAALERLKKTYPNEIRLAERICAGDLIRRECNITPERVKQQLRIRTDNEFTQSTGYLPNLKTFEQFRLSRKTQELVSKQAYELVKKELDKNGLVMTRAMPNTYTEATVRGFVTGIIFDNANYRWQRNVSARLGREIPPGLTREQFETLFTELPKVEIPEKDVLSENDFFEQTILPRYTAEVEKQYIKITEGAEDYANFAEKEDEGKNFMRIVYIPPIALGLSLIIAVITIGKNIIFIGGRIGGLLSRQIGWGHKKYLKPIVQGGAWVLYFIGFALLVHTQSNTYTQTKTYQRYYTAAKERAPLTIAVLHGIVHVQPIIYAKGQYVINIIEKDVSPSAETAPGDTPPQ